MAPQLPSNSNKFNFSLDLRIVVGVLLAIIVVMLVLWRPGFNTKPTGDRTVEITGEATISAAPDEFVFYPTYDFKGADKAAALSQLTAKSNEVVAKLKEVGVPEKGIKTNSNGYDAMPYPKEPDSAEITYNLQLTVTVDNKELAQKVQDYLVTTAPLGSVSPQASFSDQKRKELETQARNQAAKDAREKADQMAKEVGFKIDKVKSISDGQGFDAIPYAVGRGAVAMDAASPTSSSLTIQPGENDLPYTVRVVYFIR